MPKKTKNELTCEIRDYQRQIQDIYFKVCNLDAQTAGDYATNGHKRSIGSARIMLSEAQQELERAIERIRNE